MQDAFIGFSSEATALATKQATADLISEADVDDDEETPTQEFWDKVESQAMIIMINNPSVSWQNPS